MTTITVFGHSDDLIEFEGDLREEIGWYEDSKPCHIAFSDGTLLSILYDKDGIWRISRVAVGSTDYQKTEGTSSEHDYSDRVTLTGDIFWVKCKDETFLLRAK
jgi:hypothetical protein